MRRATAARRSYCTPPRTVSVRRATLRELATCDVRRPTQAGGRSGETAACEVAENCAAIWGVLAKGATLEVQRVTLRVQ